MNNIFKLYKKNHEHAYFIYNIKKLKKNKIKRHIGEPKYTSTLIFTSLGCLVELFSVLIMIIFVVYVYFFLQESTITEKVVSSIVLIAIAIFIGFRIKKDFRYLKTFKAVNRETKPLTIDFDNKTIHNGADTYSFKDIEYIKAVSSSKNDLIDKNQSYIMQNSENSEVLLYLISKNKDNIFFMILHSSMIDSEEYKTIISYMEQELNISFINEYN